LEPERSERAEMRLAGLAGGEPERSEAINGLAGLAGGEPASPSARPAPAQLSLLDATFLVVASVIGRGSSLPPGSDR